MKKTPRALKSLLDSNLEVFQNAKVNPWVLVEVSEECPSMGELDNSEFRLRLFQEWKALTLEIAKSSQYERWTKTPHVTVTFNNKSITQKEVKIISQIFKEMRNMDLKINHFWNPWTSTLEPESKENFLNEN